jgi:hypothetical protein
MRAMTEPHLTAIPLAVMSPSLSPKVPKPEINATCRSDHVEAIPNFSDLLRSNRGDITGAIASTPTSRSLVTICPRRLSLTCSPIIRDRAHLSETYLTFFLLSDFVASV